MRNSLGATSTAARMVFGMDDGMSDAATTPGDVTATRDASSRRRPSPVESLGQPEKTIVEGIGISRTTLSRRKQSGRLGFVDSERAVRLGTIIALGKAALGSTAAAGRWLLKPNAALGGVVPIGLLQTDVGARQVEAVLGRALLGGYS